MSDAGSSIPQADPPWGNPAPERYLLQHWDPDSSETPDQQRKRLVRAFIHAGPGRSLQKVSPTATQIAKILQPWRTLEQRKIANDNSMGRAVWLRTCYTEGSEIRHEELVEPVQMDMTVDDRVLNDPLLYNYGPAWQRVFDVMPELLQPYHETWSSYEDGQRKAVEALSAYAAGGLARAPPQLVENLYCPNGVPGFPGAIGMRGQVLEYHVGQALQSNVHHTYVVSWLVLEDEEALETGNVAIIFLDALGNIIRSKRVTAQDPEHIAGLWGDGSFVESAEWENGELGSGYQTGGSRGNLLLESMRNARP